MNRRSVAPDLERVGVLARWRTRYFSDTPRFVIYRYDYDLATEAASNRREFVPIEPTATDRASGRRRRRRGGVLLVIAIRRLSGAQIRPCRGG
jgi:hypothetical protein